MGRNKILIPKDELYQLYIVENLSPSAIGLRFGCDGVTIRSRIKEAGITLKSKSAAQTHYPRVDFTGSDVEKAYMLGFRYGDLNVYKPASTSETLVIRSHTTQLAQEAVFNKLFSSYGTIVTSRNERHIYTTFYANMSFLFLLEKYNEEIESWVKEEITRLWAFTAGYIDAEGTFGMNQSRGRFKIDAYDYTILKDIHEFLQSMNIRSLFRKIASQGEDKYGTIWNHDLWRLSVNKANSLERMIVDLSPYLIHSDRIRHARAVLDNIMRRREYGSVR